MTSSLGFNFVYAVAYFVVSTEHVLRVILLSYSRVYSFLCGISALDRYMSRMFFLRGILQVILKDTIQHCVGLQYRESDAHMTATS